MALYLHALRNADSLHMRISGLVSEAMVNDDMVSISEEFELHAFNDSVSGSIYRIARIHRKIHTRMAGHPSVNRVGPVTEAA